MRTQIYSGTNEHDGRLIHDSEIKIAPPKEDPNSLRYLYEHGNRKTRRKVVAHLKAIKKRGYSPTGRTTP